MMTEIETARKALIRAVGPSISARPVLDQRLWDMASRYRLQPLLAHFAVRGSIRVRGVLSPAPKVPRNTTLARNLLIQSSQDRVLGRFRSRGIAAVCLKGTGLAEAVYPDLACRPTGDVDLLVRRKVVPSAVRLLREMGYAPVGPLPELDRFHEATFSYRGGGARIPPVDLHWGLCAERFGIHARFDFDLSEDDVWSKADLRRHRLSPGMTLVHSILHAFTNSFSMFSDFVDVLYVYRAVSHQVRWVDWVGQVRRFRMGAVAAFALKRVADWWNIEFPAALARMVEEDLPLACRLGLLNGTAWRGDIGGWKERLAMPVFFQPPTRIPLDYLRMVFDLVHFRR